MQPVGGFVILFSFVLDRVGRDPHAIGADRQPIDPG